MLSNSSAPRRWSGFGGISGMAHPEIYSSYLGTVIAKNRL
jgi:hypothetical protein